jgi:hypothetical protein
MIIRSEHVKTLGALTREQFIQSMIEHLYGFAPDHAKILGTETLEKIIELGIQRAGSYGFTQKGPVRFYIELMFLLGSDFDTDPQFTWASTILNRPWDDDYELRRTGELFWAMNRFLDAAAGPGKDYIVAGLQRTMAGGLDFVPDPGGDILGQMLRHLGRLAPEQHGTVGEQALRSLIKRGFAAARTYNAQTLADQSFVVLLMFWFGHGCLTDLQFPWMGLTLRREPALPQQSDVFQNLRRKTYLYLQHALDNLPKLRRH